MNQAHLHLLFNHLPIIITLTGLITLAAGYLLKNQTVKRTALGIFILAAACAIPAQFTGEGAEEVVEEIPGITHAVIEHHEEKAFVFFCSVLALGVVSAIALITDIRGKAKSKLLIGLSFVIAVAATVLGQQTGTSGGEIRHTEIRK